MGIVVPTHAQFESTSPLLDVSLIACVGGESADVHTARACWGGPVLPLAMALFMIRPSITLRNPNSLLQPHTSVLSTAVLLNHGRVCDTWRLQLHTFSN